MLQKQQKKLSESVENILGSRENLAFSHHFFPTKKTDTCRHTHTYYTLNSSTAEARVSLKNV